jgi:hypothetical protein
MLDASHEEIVVEEDDFIATNVQLDSIGDKNEIQPNLGAVPVTQLVSAGTTINRHVDEAIQLNST